MTFIDQIMRQIKPEKRLKSLTPRPQPQLEFLGKTAKSHDKLLYDTTVYIDILQAQFPGNGEWALQAADAWHSTVTESELAASCGLLDPRHPDTKMIIERIAATLARRPAHRTIAPDREIWQRAGVLSGTLARLQQYTKAEQRRVLNDALIFSTARKHGLTVLTRNVRDFDLLQQIDRAGRVLFYSR